jgi:glyoxylase-like metal-dependent hydrolase (beta-lactamase superfamily II)
MSMDSTDPEPVDHGAWMKPGVFPVADGVWRIPLPLPMKDLSCVNSWLFTAGDDVVLVDPGWASVESETTLSDALRSLDLDFTDVRRIAITHTHWDHYSEAMLIRLRYGTPISVGEGERATVEAYRPGDAFFSRQSARLFACGAEVLARTVAALPPEPYEVGLLFLPPDEWLDSGQAIPLGSRNLVSYATPGHTAGHMVFSDPANGLMITGDHVLPRITPSIGLELRPEAFPLRSFLRSLAFVKTLPDAKVLPAHGNITDSIHQRADELLAHHESRFDVVTEQLKDGPDTAMAIASRMKWTRRGRDLDEIVPVHQMAAVLEIAAHLDVLKQRGSVTVDVVDGIEVFAAA